MLTKNLVPVLFLSLLFASCSKPDMTTEKEFTVAGFTRIYSGENIILTIEKGDEFHVRAKGRAGNIDKLHFNLTDNNTTLDISYDDETQPVNVIITMPYLKKVSLTGNGSTQIRNFPPQIETLDFTLSGHARVSTVNCNTSLVIDVTGNATLMLDGSTQNLTGIVSGNGNVNAYGLLTDIASITASHTAKVYVRATSMLVAKAYNDSYIYYMGDPQNMQVETYQNGKVIKD